MTGRDDDAPYRFEIRTGEAVLAGSESVGEVDRLVLDPSSGRVVGLVVRRGLLLRRDVFIPIEAVERSDEYAVHLRVSLDELNAGDAYALERAHDAEPGQPGGRGATAIPVSRLEARTSGQVEAAAGGRPIRAGQRVEASDGKVGTLDVVLVDARTGRATAFVVRRGLFLVHDTVVPIELVDEIERDRIRLRVRRDALAELPEYRPDEEITGDVLDELWYETDLDPREVRFVYVRTRDGIVELLGHTVTEEARQRIEAAAWRVKGVLGVRNRLKTFEALEREVQEARRRRGSAAVGATS